MFKVGDEVKGTSLLSGNNWEGVIRKQAGLPESWFVHHYGELDIEGQWRFHPEEFMEHNEKQNEQNEVS